MIELNKNLQRYFEFFTENPELFNNLNDGIIIELDPEILQKQSKTKNIGIVYESKFHIMIVDLVHNGDKNYYTYERIVGKTKGNGSVILPTVGDKIVILKQFRHALRKQQYALPRGFATSGLDSEQNAIQEVIF